METKKAISIVILATIVAMVGIGAASAGNNLVVNGGFEEPALSSGSYDIYPSIPGWSLVYGAFEVQNHVAGNPYEGNQHLELDAYRNANIYQDITTLPGKHYTLTFAFSPRPGVADNKLQISWNGNIIDTLSKSGTGKYNTDWALYTYDLTATGTTTRLGFENLDSPDSYGTYLDAVSVTQVESTSVPEFPTVALPIIGIIGLMFLFQRRRANK